MRKAHTMITVELAGVNGHKKLEFVWVMPTRKLKLNGNDVFEQAKDR